MTDITEAHREAVRNGVELLDRHFGDAMWRNDINLNDLDISSCTTCVLGQLFGSYMTGAQKIGIDDSVGYIVGAPYGFDCDPVRGEEFSAVEDRRILTEAWLDYLKA